MMDPEFGQRLQKIYTIARRIPRPSDEDILFFDPDGTTGLAEFWSAVDEVTNFTTPKAQADAR